VITVLIGTRLASARVGLMAGLMVAANLEMFLFGRMVKPDLLFVACILLGLYGFILAYLGQGRWPLLLAYMHPAEAAARCDAEVEPSVAQLVDGGRRRGELQRIVQRRDQHRYPQPQPGGARGRVGEEFHRCDKGRPADGLLERPTAVEAELFGPLEKASRARRVEAVDDQLGN